ncbi:sugar phosphate isomerase/epimerase [Pedobacter hiemivivus]|uniref:Sugar phosphate isomerase/epimerase n=1 Tax=Pedobacter hiemivivus TaxID=2530454 RepID=A0A4U1GE74_9SPHI|nr:sugar phosphate isomerase/epimerase [Pedobacter hiemivivus]TKC62375.1 sugar phosphate isomerase/epimerase [Pedobacter hiemivivus]
MPEKLTRRSWNRLVLTGLSGVFISSIFASCKTAAVISGSLKETGAAKDAKELGLMLGVQTYSFRDRSLDDAIKAMQELGAKSCELWEGHVEPRQLQWAAGQTTAEVKNKREQLKAWREHLSMKEIEGIKLKFDQAGISIQAYNAGIKDGITDEDLDLAFKIAQTLGVNAITTSATVSVMERVDVYAKKYKMIVAMHNHSHTDRPNEFSSPDSFARAMKGRSEYLWINLDIGHFTAAGFDAVDYIQNNHEKILSIHIKDRKKQQGLNMPLGEGDTPITKTLQLIRDNKWPIPANIEYEYKGGDTVEEVRKCLAYCKKGLRG